MSKKQKPGPDPKPLSMKQRHAVMVRFADAEYAAIKRLAQHLPLAAYLREKGLAS